MSTSHTASLENLTEPVQASESILETASPRRHTTAVQTLEIEPDALRMLPVDFVKRHLVLPLRIEDGTLYIATAQPGQQRVIDDIRLLSGLEVQERELPEKEVLAKIDRKSVV